MLFLIPFVILNPICFVLMLANTSGSLPEWLFWVLLSASSIWWWWHLGGVAARRLGRVQAGKRRTRSLQPGDSG